MYYDREGKQIDAREWVRLFKSDEYKRVALDAVGPVRVSTVWLGLDHSFNGDSAPLIFETMVFEGDSDGDCERYTTLTEAQRGHEAMLAKVRSAGQGAS